MARRKKGNSVNGWLILDKPSGLTSTSAVSRVRRLFNAQKAGHAGTLDPLATGILPIALGEATKTVPYAVDQDKVYRFTVNWGVETNTDDSEGEPVTTSTKRPTTDSILAVLDQFTGEITQIPPRFSAVKIDGDRAYDLARNGKAIELAARTVNVHELKLIDCPEPDYAIFETTCGKGTYVRSLARDIGRTLGCYGHITSLRRLAVGEFREALSVKLDDLVTAHDSGGPDVLLTSLQPVEFALKQMPSFKVSPSDAASLCRGQAIILRGRDAPILTGLGYAVSGGHLIALVNAEKGCLRPFRVFHQNRENSG